MSITDIFSLLGGVGLFLFGMTIMSSGLKSACGNNLQNILEKATKNKVIAVLVGIGMTMLIQSSSATDVMVIGFVNSAMMSLSQAIGVIMGANIGTTITAQITAFNLSAYAPLILFVGAVMFLFIAKKLIKYIGEILMGFGMLFFGISVMKSAIVPLSETKGFIHFISGLSNPFLAILFGVAFTALLQSSSSSTVIFQAFAIQGMLEYHTAVYLVIGAAIGSVTPNLLASLTTNRNGKRTALLNLIFNIIRACILVLIINLIPGVLDLIQSLSPEDVGRQIANTHTIFAITAVLIELPFTGYIIKLAEKIIPVKAEENQELEERSLQYMLSLNGVPISMAISQAHREVTRMGRIAVKNLKESIDCFFHYSEEKAERVRSREQSINILNSSIADAMVELKSLDLTADHVKMVTRLTVSVNDIERLSDHAENVVEYIEDMIKNRAKFSDTALKELHHMADSAMKSVNLAMDIFDTVDASKLEEMEAIEASVDMQQDLLIRNHVNRLLESCCDPVAGVAFIEMVTALERCSDHAMNLADALIEKPVEAME